MTNLRGAWLAWVSCLAFTLAQEIPAAEKEERRGPPIPAGPEILAKLRKGHPRLLASAQEFTQLKQQVTSNGQLRDWHSKLIARADRILADPPSRYEIPDGLRLLSTSRRVLDRAYTLGLLFRLNGESRYAERLWQELEAAAAFPDWNPRHFLDTAEMTHAFAVSYDWLFEVWTEAQRGVIRTAILEKGLQPALASYRGSKSYGWWTKARHNWNQVCNGGIGMGALAIAEEAPDVAGEILHAGVELLPLAMAEFGPDGAWNEGPGYWNYATSYNVVFLAALETSLGTDFGLSRIPGFAETGLFPMYLTGPLGRTFNYADGSDGTIRAAQMFWMARKFGQPAYAQYQQRIASPSALDLLWFDTHTKLPSSLDLPLDKYFRRAEVVSFRSAWEKRDAVFVAFKAGDNKANHSNLDLGTFVLDALGTRWAVDLGADNYNLPGYFGKQRWTYYRMRAESHNTLVINPDLKPDQDPAAFARIIRFDSKPDRAYAIADLTSAYAERAQKVWRGIALIDRQQVLVQDEIEAKESSQVWWFMHTPAQVELSPDKTSAILTQGTARLHAQVLSPSKATFAVLNAEPLPTSPRPSGQAKNQAIRKLAVNYAGSKEVRLAVVLTPMATGESLPPRLPSVAPLEKW